MPAKALCLYRQFSYGAGSRICRRIISPTGACVIDRIHDSQSVMPTRRRAWARGHENLKSLNTTCMTFCGPSALTIPFPREGRDHARNTLAVELMAGCAVAKIGLALRGLRIRTVVCSTTASAGTTLR